MLMSTEAPDGYAYGHVLGKNLFHLVKRGVYNFDAVCGKQVYSDSMTDSASPNRRVCGKCWKIVVKGGERKAAPPTPPPRKIYPEHEKLRLVAGKTQFVHDFLTFLESKGIGLEHKDGNRRPSTDDLLYEFINVDRWKLEDEKRAMLGQDPIPGVDGK